MVVDPSKLYNPNQRRKYTGGERGRDQGDNCIEVRANTM